MVLRDRRRRRSPCAAESAVDRVHVPIARRREPQPIPTRERREMRGLGNAHQDSMPSLPNRNDGQPRRRGRRSGLPVVPPPVPCRTRGDEGSGRKSGREEPGPARRPSQRRSILGRGGNAPQGVRDGANGSPARQCEARHLQPLETGGRFRSRSCVPAPAGKSRRAIGGV